MRSASGRAAEDSERNRSGTLRAPSPTRALARQCLPRMQRSDFDYELPEALVAQAPLPSRTGSRLMVLDAVARSVVHARFTDIEALLAPSDLLVVNDTRVIPARLHGVKDSGGRVEILIERLLDDLHVLAHLRASKPLRPDGGVLLDGAANLRVVVVERLGELYKVRFPHSVLGVLEQHGHVPLPPYVERQDTPDDRLRYQTVYAARDGAIAAPTAGLHFDAPLLARLADKGVTRVAITLHVGAGTFQPMRTDDLAQHHMHAEWCEVSAAVVAAVAATRRRGGRVVAVGTTAVRALETAAASGQLLPFVGDTALFIRPGHALHVVDALITNFHLPQSTLLALVATLVGREFLLDAYRQAVAERYRFFSYGDAMFIQRRLAQ